jgi:hypothetical protein
MIDMKTIKVTFEVKVSNKTAALMEEADYQYMVERLTDAAEQALMCKLRTYRHLSGYHNVDTYLAEISRETIREEERMYELERFR